MSDTSEIKWEYKQQRIDAWKLEEKEKLFNDLGDKGWELVSIRLESGENCDCAWFKRRKASEDGPQSIFED